MMKLTNVDSFKLNKHFKSTLGIGKHVPCDLVFYGHQPNVDEKGGYHNNFISILSYNLGVDHVPSRHIEDAMQDFFESDYTVKCDNQYVTHPVYRPFIEEMTHFSFDAKSVDASQQIKTFNVLTSEEKNFNNGHILAPHSYFLMNYDARADSVNFAEVSHGSFVGLLEIITDLANQKRQHFTDETLANFNEQLKFFSPGERQAILAELGKE